MTKVIVKGYILVPEKDLLAVKKALPAHIALTRNEAGCLVFDVTQDPSNSLRFNVYEEFSSTQAFADHQQRIQHSTWAKITTDVERHYDIEEVSSA